MGRKPSRWTNLPKGMRARVRKYGTYYFFDTGAKPRKEIALGSDFVEAVRKWAELSREVMPVGICHTFISALESYLVKEIPLKAPRTQSDNIKEMTYLREFFGNPPAPLDEIQPIHIRQYMTWRVQKAKEIAQTENVKRMERGLMPLVIKPDLGKVRANRDKALFSHIFNFARNEGMTAAHNPCAGIKGFKETGRDVYVEDEVYKKVYVNACEPLKEAMDLAYLTGQRPADVLRYNLQDIRDNNLTVRQGKTEKKLRFEISGELANLVERINARRKEIDKTKVVAMALIVKEDGTPLTASALRSRFDKARELAGVDKATFQFRDLRAKAGTDKADSDDILAARKQLGHASVTMTEAYVRNRRGEKVKPTR